MADTRAEINSIDCMPTYLLGDIEYKNFTYDDYAAHSPMRDGEEIRIFLDGLNDEEW